MSNTATVDLDKSIAVADAMLKTLVSAGPISGGELSVALTYLTLRFYRLAEGAINDKTQLIFLQP